MILESKKDVDVHDQVMPTKHGQPVLYDSQPETPSSISLVDCSVCLAFFYGFSDNLAMEMKNLSIVKITYKKFKVFI